MSSTAAKRTAPRAARRRAQRLTVRLPAARLVKRAAHAGKSTDSEIPALHPSSAAKLKAQAKGNGPAAAESAVVQPVPEVIPEPVERDRSGYDSDTAIKLYLREIGQVKLLTPQEETQFSFNRKSALIHIFPLFNIAN